jgi:hypothetical protein
LVVAAVVSSGGLGGWALSAQRGGLGVLLKPLSVVSAQSWPVDAETGGEAECSTYELIFQLIGELRLWFWVSVGWLYMA